MIMNDASCWSRVLVPGVIIWRGGYFRAKSGCFGVTEVDASQFEKAHKGNGYIGRFDLFGSGVEEPSLGPSVVTVDQRVYKTRGVVAIMKERPRADWTYMVVEGVCTAMRSPGLQPASMTVFVGKATPLGRYFEP